MTIKERIAFHRSRADVETDLAPQLTRILALVEAAKVACFCKTDCAMFDLEVQLAKMQKAGDIETPTRIPDSMRISVDDDGNPTGELEAAGDIEPNPPRVRADSTPPTPPPVPAPPPAR